MDDQTLDKEVSVRNHSKILQNKIGLILELRVST